MIFPIWTRTFPSSPTACARSNLPGLVPGFVGLYQVNVKVPSDVTGGSTVPLQSGIASNTVTLAIR